MSKLSQLSKEEFSLWLKEQLEKREVLYGYKTCWEELKQEIYRIIFEEGEMKIEDIEQMYLPYGQEGFWSAREKFELMIYLMDKDYYAGALYFLDGVGTDLTEEIVDEIYLDWASAGAFVLSEEEKKDFFVQRLADSISLDVVEVLNRVAADGFLLGEFCPPLYEEEPLEHRAAVCNHGGMIRLPFLGVDEKELVRIIKCIVARENKGELTYAEPVWECVKEDGTCITAVRPPTGNNWGLRVLYGAAGKDKRRWQM